MTVRVRGNCVNVGVVINSGDNPKGSHYWTRTTSHYQDQNSNTFGADMNGVSNPIITVFRARWPVRI